VTRDLRAIPKRTSLEPMEQWATGLNARNVFGELSRASFNASESADRYCLFVARRSRDRKLILSLNLAPMRDRTPDWVKTSKAKEGASEVTETMLEGGDDESEDGEDGTGAIRTNGDFNDNTGGSGG